VYSTIGAVARRGSFCGGIDSAASGAEQCREEASSKRTTSSVLQSTSISNRSSFLCDRQVLTSGPSAVGWDTLAERDEGN
jgi:hypothetical protein